MVTNMIRNCGRVTVTFLADWLSTENCRAEHVPSFAMVKLRPFTMVVVLQTRRDLTILAAAVA
jgi:hypothetical protein